MKFTFGNYKRYSITSLGNTKNGILSIEELYCKCTFDLDEENLSSNNNTDVNNKENSSHCENENISDYDTAIKATLYGKYNWFLLFIGLWGYVSSKCATTSISLVLPTAECDLQLTNYSKGMLNAAIYIGMLASAFFWSLVADSLGRRIVLLVGFGLDAVFCILIGLSQSFGFLFFFKLLSGFVSSSLIAILSTFVAENHARKYEALLTVTMGISLSIASIILPVLAWVIIPLPIRWTFFNGFIQMPSWRIFLLATAFPSTITFISLLFCEESPKFLWSQNRQEEALKVFQRIYSSNTGNAIETFPVKRLAPPKTNNSVQSTDEKLSLKKIMKAALKQVHPAFQKPYLHLIILTCCVQFCTVLSANTLKLWSPQYFALVFEYENMYNESATSICELFDSDARNRVDLETRRCNEKVIVKDVYFDSMITGIVTIFAHIILGLIAKATDRKWLLTLIYILGIASSSGLNWSADSNYILGVMSVFLSLTSTAVTTLSSLIIVIFPTFLRATALTICITFGRLGAMTGNLIFPVLLNWKCASPFIFLASSLLVAALVTIFLPKTRGKETH